MAVNFHIMTGLRDVNTIEHIQETLSFEGHQEDVVDHIQQDVLGTRVGGCNCKVVNLSLENDAVAVHPAGVEAQFVDS
jgi:hypothetical protein